MVDLKAIRKKAGMSQEKLAEQCNVVRQTISNIECGVSSPSVETAKVISEVLNIEWEDFFRD